MYTANQVANDYESDVFVEKKQSKCSLKCLAVIFCTLLLGVIVTLVALIALDVIDLDDISGNGDDDIPPPDPVQLDETLVVNGLQRNFTVFVPSSYFANSEAAVPLVFVFHGFTSNRFQIQEQYALEETAERENFIAVFPDGVNEAWDVFFPDVAFGGFPANQDLPFVSSMLDFMKTEFNIKEESVYSTGHSNGALFSTVIACFLPDDFAAVAPVAGGFVNSIAAACPQNPVPYFQIHGTADVVVPIDGLESLAIFDPSLAGFSLFSIDDALTFWALANNLDLVPVVTPVDNVVDKFVFPEANTVQHLRLNGVGHFMSDISAVVNIIEEVVAFFKETTDF